MSPAGAAPNDSLLNLYLPNQHVNVVKYDDLLSNLMMWYPELASIRDKYLTLFDFGKISLNVDPLWTGLIGAWFSLARSRHSLTLPLGFGMRTKLLHYITISSMPKVIMSCCWSLSSSCLNNFCSAYAMCLGGTWYGVLSGFTCYENIPSKHPIPIKTSSHSFSRCFVISALAFCHSPCLDLEESIQFHYCLVMGHYMVYCLNLIAIIVCVCLSLCLGLKESIQLHYC